MTNRTWQPGDDLVISLHPDDGERWAEAAARVGMDLERWVVCACEAFAAGSRSEAQIAFARNRTKAQSPRPSHLSCRDPHRVPD